MIVASYLRGSSQVLTGSLEPDYYIFKFLEKKLDMVYFKAVLKTSFQCTVPRSGLFNVLIINCHEMKNVQNKKNMSKSSTCFSRKNNLNWGKKEVFFIIIIMVCVRCMSQCQFPLCCNSVTSYSGQGTKRLMSVAFKTLNHCLFEFSRKIPPATPPMLCVFFLSFFCF